MYVSVLNKQPPSVAYKSAVRFNDVSRLFERRFYRFNHMNFQFQFRDLRQLSVIIQCRYFQKAYRILRTIRRNLNPFFSS